MKKNAEKSKMSWGEYKRLAEKYLADPLHGPKQDILKEKSRQYQEQYQKIISHVRTYMGDKCSTDKISDPGFKEWFQRQGARNKFQSSIIRHEEGLYYIPVAFELSDGCSVGCNFCCLAAKQLNAVYRYTKEHAKEWRQILDATRAVIGDFAGAGLCYFATEPFDNPDYELFLEDFRDVLGWVPQTTRAAADRNVRRTKDFLGMLGEEELAHAAVRFSITSLEQLHRIHEAFTPDELAYVELLTNNPESINCYSKAGRALKLSETMMEKTFLDTASSVCTNGFVVNLHRHSVMLVTVHRPDEKHPLGMEVLEEKSFLHPEEYQNILSEMIGKWMRVSVPLDCPMELSDYISLEQSGFRLKIKGDKISRMVTAGEAEQRGFQLLLTQGIPVEEILKEIPMTEYEKKRFLKNVELFYQSGYMEERREKNGLESGKDQ